MKHLRKFLHLPPAEQRLLVSATVLLGAIRLGLWLLPFRTLQGLLHRLVPRLGQRLPSGPTPMRLSIDRLAWAIAVAGRYVPKATCLTQALAMQVLLARRAYPAHLHIGVAKQAETGQFEAHAWVESGGRIVIGGSERGRCTPLLGPLEKAYERTTAD